MVSDGDSSTDEAIKLTYINALLKNLAHANSFGNHASMDYMDKTTSDDYDSFLAQLSTEQYESNLVRKEDCINHVRMRVSSHLKTMKSQNSDFEDVHNED